MFVELLIFRHLKTTSVWDVNVHGKYENVLGTDHQGRDTLSHTMTHHYVEGFCISVVVPRPGHWFIARKAHFPDLTLWR